MNNDDITMMIYSMRYSKIIFKFFLLTVSTIFASEVLAANNINYVNNFTNSFSPNLPNNPNAPISTIKTNAEVPVQQAIYICYKFLTPYMQNFYQGRQCDTYTGYCTVLGIPKSYWPQQSTECRMQRTPCQGKWLLFGKFDQYGNNKTPTPQPYAYRKYDPYRDAEAAYASCVTNKSSINKPPGI
jgi:hypothetical protein